MKKKNTVTLEELGTKKVNVDKQFNLMKFLKKDVLTKFLICVVIAVILVLVFTISSVNHVKTLGCKELFCDSEGITISENFISRLEMLLLTAFAAMVPYFYMPYLGLVAYMYNEIITIAHIINIYGYAIGILKYILPLILNILTIGLVTAVSVYMEKIATHKFILSRHNAMNFTSFRMKIYQMLKKQDKYEKLYEKQQKRIDKIKQNTEKIKWKGVIITFVAAVIIQFLSTVLQNILV